MDQFSTLAEGIANDRFAAAHYRALLASSPHAIVAADNAGIIQLVNHNAEVLFGYSPGELLGQSVELLVPERVRDIHVEERKEYLACPRARPMGIGIELKGRRRDGSEFPVEISLAHVRVGADTAVLAFITNITNRTDAEKREGEMQRIGASGRLAGRAADEFGLLLDVISEQARVALDKCQDDPALRSALGAILVASDRADLLSRKLLAFSRGEKNQLRWFDPNQELSSMHQALCDALGVGIELNLVLGEDIGEILGDPLQFGVVIQNLIRNAAEAMPHGGRVTIETAAMDIDEDVVHGHLPLSPGPHLLLKITDTGTGMTPEVQSRIFEPFFTTKAGQTGLGLAAVYAIVRDAGGSITASSQPDQGCTFHPLFPRIWRVGPNADD